MKPSLLCLFMGLTLALQAQEQLTGINATFIFFNGKDTVDMKNPIIPLGSPSINFVVKSRVKINRVYYEVTGGPAGGKPVGTVKDFGNEYISYRNFHYSLRSGDIISLVIQYIEDEEGKRYKPPKTNYRFTLK